MSSSAPACEFTDPGLVVAVLFLDGYLAPVRRSMPVRPERRPDGGTGSDLRGRGYGAALSRNAGGDRFDVFDIGRLYSSMIYSVKSPLISYNTKYHPKQFILGSFLKWRTIAAVSTIFPILSITALFFVPESPHWLLTKGRTVEAQKALAWLRGWVPVNQVKVEYDEIYDLLVLQPAHNSANNSSGRSACDQTVSRYLKKSFMRPYALIALTFFIGHFSGKTTLQTYAVQVRKTAYL